MVNYFDCWINYWFNIYIIDCMENNLGDMKMIWILLTGLLCLILMVPLSFFIKVFWQLFIVSWILSTIIIIIIGTWNNKRIEEKPYI